MKKGVFLLFICLAFTVGVSSVALAQMSEITPNGIVYLNGTDTLTVGQACNVSAQLTYAGGPLKSEGVRVYFLSSNASIIPAELGTYVLTDKSGVATYTVTPIGAGNVKLTVMAMSSISGVSAEKRFNVTVGGAATPPAPTLTPTPCPRPSPSPSPSASASATTVHPTQSTTPTTTPPTVAPAAGGANAQALGIITVGIVIAVIVIVIVLLSKASKK